MRLNESTNRANTNIVNTLLGEKANNGGSKSSLDYKAKGNDVLTTAKATKDGKKKKNKQRQSNQEQQQHEEQERERKNYRKSSFPTRVRDGTGIPPRRYDLSDLGKMDEHDLLNAIREDPEFAAAVQEYSAQLEEKEKADKSATEERKNRRSNPSSPPVAARRKARMAKSSSSSKPTGIPSQSPSLEERPDQVQELVDRDVPVAQWIALLLLVGAGLYFLMGPELKEVFAYIVKRTGVKAKRRTQKFNGNKSKQRSRQYNKGKNKADKSRKSFITKKTITMSEPKEPVEPVTPAPTPKLETHKQDLHEATGAKKAKNKKKKKKQNVQPQVEEKDSVDLISTDGSTHAEETTAVSPRPIKRRLSHSLMIYTEADDTDAGEWETVTRSRKPAGKSSNTASEVPITTEEKESESETPVDTTVQTTKSDDTDAGDWLTVTRSRKSADKSSIAASEVPVTAEEESESESETPVNTTLQTSTVEAETPKQPVDTQQDKEVGLITTAQGQTANNGWETVTKSRKASSSKASSPKDGRGRERTASPADSESKPVVEADSEPNLAAEAVKDEDKKKQASNGADNEKAKKKKSQNKKKGKKATESARIVECDDTIGDAALALKLQLEEEKLANQGKNKQPEEQWEEVKKNKSKKGQKTTPQHKASD